MLVKVVVLTCILAGVSAGCFIGYSFTTPDAVRPPQPEDLPSLETVEAWAAYYGKELAPRHFQPDYRATVLATMLRLLALSPSYCSFRS